ncbi:Os02g0579900 [Oryza sativa Japonica Group]|uniref:Os02g0579900 protein n=2 Tax=Oryza sativa subsp. japonica TaxID=39947 RepID=Q6EP47_ORYSJ|nr:hypothetical protein [Oryza sativa Japonica Group]BAS79409.1 Os02g0579900 [Oryza sativa Japonica Group]
MAGSGGRGDSVGKEDWAVSLLARSPLRAGGGGGDAGGGAPGRAGRAALEASPGGGGSGRRGRRGEENRAKEDATAVEPQIIVPVAARPLPLAAPSSSPHVVSSSSPRRPRWQPPPPPPGEASGADQQALPSPSLSPGTFWAQKSPK